MDELIRNGRLTVPLFHGTSSHFYDSIVTYGLGGRDILSDLGVRNAAKLLIELCPGDGSIPDWESEIHFLRRIAPTPAEQISYPQATMSFRYGGVCVSPSRTTAAGYSSKCGSEALRTIVELLNKVDSLRPDLTLDYAFKRIRGFARQSGEPIVIEAREVEVCNLRAENGGSAESILDFIRDTPREDLDDPEFYDLWLGQSNFELSEPIPSGQLRFHSVRKYMDEKGSERFEFTPLLVANAVRSSHDFRS